jgi:hypothetical protein
MNGERAISKMNLIFKCVTGSQAYGTNTPTSDTDHKGVYVQRKDDILSFRYEEQFEAGKDECYYEVRRFIQLLASANPTMLELLFMPKDCVIQQDPAFDLIVSHRNKFLTKKCLQSFGGYAVAQIKKAKGLDKKMNYEKERIVRKTPFDFCYVHEDGKSIPLEKYLTKEKLKQEHCGLAAIDHFRDCYAAYYDYNAQFGTMTNRPHPGKGYRGICIDAGNELRLSNIPKGEKPFGVLFFNKDGYSTHCKDFNQYTVWLENRSEQRFVDVKGHDQKIDGKNILHCRRLLDMAKEIAEEKTINVRRPNAKYLLSIRRGEVDIQSIIYQAEADIVGLDEVYANSGLPAEVDKDFMNNLLLAVRNFY